jgi:hypothetical protein
MPIRHSSSFIQKIQRDYRKDKLSACIMTASAVAGRIFHHTDILHSDSFIPGRYPRQIKASWHDATLFVYFDSLVVHTIHSITFIRRHSPRFTFIPSHSSVAIRRSLDSFYHIHPSSFAVVPLHLLIASA